LQVQRTLYLVDDHEGASPSTVGSDLEGGGLVELFVGLEIVVSGDVGGSDSEVEAIKDWIGVGVVGVVASDQLLDDPLASEESLEVLCGEAWEGRSGLRGLTSTKESGEDVGFDATDGERQDDGEQEQLLVHLFRKKKKKKKKKKIKIKKKNKKKPNTKHPNN